MNNKLTEIIAENKKWNEYFEEQHDQETLVKLEPVNKTIKFLLSLIEEKDKANEELRSAAWAAEKYINGTAILFSHRTKEAVLSRLVKALEPYRINDDTSSNNKGETV